MRNLNNVTSFVSTMLGVDCSDIEVGGQRQLLFDMIKNNPADRTYTIDEIENIFNTLSERPPQEVSRNITNVINTYYEMLVDHNRSEIFHECAEDLHIILDSFNNHRENKEEGTYIVISEVLDLLLPLKKSEVITMRHQLVSEINRLQKRVVGLDKQLSDIKVDKS